MILTADIGNTRIKYALWNDGNTLLQTGICHSDDEMISLISSADAFAWCSTREEIPQSWLKAAKKQFELKPGVRLTFENFYETPKTLGPDRMAAVAGAQVLFPDQNVLIIDAGTCITTDLLTAEKKYLGGSISPGLEMRYRAMHSYTGKLPLLPPQMPSKLIGANTAESMHSGVWFGIIAELEYRIGELQQQLPGLKVILTGGDGPQLADQLKFDIFAEPFIIHHGLHSCFLLNENS